MDRNGSMKATAGLTMNAAVLESMGEVVYRPVTRSPVGPGQVLVRVKAAGICGSDIGKAFGGQAHHYPVILGHEFSGEIAEIGPNVRDVQCGERVVGIPLLPCMKCCRCLRGDFYWCKTYGFVGARNDGAFAEYIVLPVDNVLSLPDALNWDQGALIEPATVAVHSAERGRVRPGHRVAIFGGGAVGLLITTWLRMTGIDQVIVLDVVEEKLKMATKLGASSTVSVLELDPLDTILEMTDGEGPDVTFETSGSPRALEQAIRASRAGGSIVQVGFMSRDLAVKATSFDLIARKELHLIGSSMSYSAPFPGYEWFVTLSKAADGAFPPPELITHRFPLSRAREAFELGASQDQYHLKVVLLP